MAIDEKFITSGISKETVKSVNQRRRRKRGRTPKPWDKPQNDTGVQNSSEAVDSTSQALGGPTIKEQQLPTLDGGHPIKNAPSNSHTKKTQSDDTKFSHIPLNADKPTALSSIVPTHNSDTEFSHNYKTLESDTIYSQTVLTQNSNTNNASNDELLFKDNDLEVSQESGDSKSKNTAIPHKHFTQKANTTLSHSNGTQENRLDSTDETLENEAKECERHEILTRNNHTNLEHSVFAQKSHRPHTELTQRTHDANTTTKVLTQKSHITSHASHTQSTLEVRIDDKFSNPFHKLSGGKQRIARYVFETMRANDITKFLITYEALAVCAEVKKTSVKTTLKRAAREHGLFNYQTLGRGPGSKIEISVTTEQMNQYLASLALKDESGRLRISHSSHTQPHTIRSSSSNITLEEKKTTSTKPYDLPEDWLEIQTPQAVKDIGFGKSNLKQLYRVAVEEPEVELTAKDVQESLYAYEADLEAGRVKANSKLGLIMAVLRRGDQYVSEVQAEELRNFIESNKKRAAELEQLQREEKLSRLKEKAEAEFSCMSDDEKLNVASENNIAKLGTSAHKHLVISALVNRMSND